MPAGKVTTVQAALSPPACGFELVKLLNERSDDADPADRAIVRAMFTKLVTEGIGGERWRRGERSDGDGIWTHLKLCRAWCVFFARVFGGNNFGRGSERIFHWPQRTDIRI